MAIATFKYQKKEWQVTSGVTVRAAIEKAGLDPRRLLALREKRLIKSQTIVEPGDEIRLVNVVWGG